MAIDKVSASEYEANYAAAMSQVTSGTTLATEEQQLTLENIIKSQQFLIDSELKKLRNDVTKLGTILETSEDKTKNGIYNVRIGDVQCEACSQNGATYNQDDVVYITIPENDYKNQKFIIGLRAESNEDGMFSYSFPFDDFVQLKELINQGENTYRYRANQRESELIKRTSEWPTINDNDWHIASYIGDYETPLIGTKVGVTVDIQALLIDARPVSGDYGLKIVVKGLTKSNSGEAGAEYTRVFYFNTAQMYGNPYVYPSFSTQQVIFDLADAFSIGSIEIYFWQDPDSNATKFINEYNEEIPWKDERLNNRPVEYNLLFKHLAVYSGYAMSEMEGNKVYLYTFNDLNYGQDPDNVADRTVYDNKTCMMAFVYQDQETGKYKLYDSDEELAALDAKVYWYIKDRDWVADSTSPVYGIEEYVRVGSPSQSHTEDYYQLEDGVYVKVQDDATINESGEYYKLQVVSHLQPYDTYAGTSLWAPIQKANPPSPIETYDQERYSDRALSFTCDLNKDDYRIRVAVEVNGQHYLSDVIIFQNVLSPEADAQSAARNDKVVLRVGMLMSLEDGTRQILYPDETLQHFMVYDENNRVLTTDDKKEIRYTYNGEELVLHGYDNVKFSDIEYFVDIWVKDDNRVVLAGQHDWNSYVRLADWAEGEENVQDNYDVTEYKYNPPFKVTWELPPTNESMMEFYRIPQEYKSTSPYFAGRNSIHVLWTGDDADSILTKFDVDDLCTRAFKIKDMYNYMYANNTITATIERAGQTFYVRREFLFGKAMAQGSCYTPMINIVLPAGNSYIVAGQRFQLECRLLDRWGRECYDDYTCTWSFVSHSESILFDGSLTGQELSDLKRPDGTTVYGHNAVLVGTAPTDCEPMVVNVSVTVTNPLDLTDHDDEAMKALGYSYENLKNEVLHARRGLRMTDDEYFLTNHTITCPDRVQFCSDGQAPQYYSGNFICKHDGKIDDEEKGLYYDDVTRFFYPIWHLRVEDQFLKNLVYLKVVSKYQSDKYPVSSSDTYDANKNYMYLDYDKGEYQSYDPDEDPDRRQWRTYANESKLVYTQVKPYGTSHGLASAVDVVSPPETNEYRMIYQPKGVGALDSEISNDSSWVWKDGYATDPLYLISLDFTVDWVRTWSEYDDEQGKDVVRTQQRTAKFIQPIALDRSLYPSSLINVWDGNSLTLDYENSAILATMIAAGTKNATTGAFTGVMMGNWAKKGDETFDSRDHRENASGLYGFLEGAGSFAFLDDGTGYIGPAGKGRIQFDGTNALISNGDKTCYINLNPNTLTQSGTGWYNADNQGISPYFLYCKIPVDPVKCISFDTERDLTWADEFMSDMDNNYFVVDPAHGLLTSGGIVSKYGRIGNWYINNSGLYQKYIHETEMRTQEEAMAALQIARNFLSLEHPMSLRDSLTDREQDYVLANTNVDVIENVTIELIDEALTSVQDSIHQKIDEGGYDFTADRFMYLGMPGLDQKALFTEFENWQEKINKANNDREIALGHQIDVPEGNDIASLLLQLYPYLDKSAFTMDVYHYFNTFIAVQANLDYIIQILQEQGILDEKQKPKITFSQEEIKTKLIERHGTFDGEGNFLSEEYETYWLNYLQSGSNMLAQGEITQEVYDNKYQAKYDEAINYSNIYQNFELVMTNYANNVKDALYNKSNLVNRLFVYKLINQHYHNHYSATTGAASPAQYGLFNNVINVLGVTLPSSARQTANFNISEDGQYYEYSGIWQSAGEKYKTINDIGAERASSYDPRPYANNEIESGITFNNRTGNVTINFWRVPSSSGMPTTAYEAPSMYSTDTDGSIFDLVWYNGTAQDSTYKINGAKLNSITVDLDYLVNTLIPDLSAYCYYYDVFYNQALFYMLEKGLAKTQQNDPDDYTYAMTIINAAGGLEQIKKVGLAASHILTANFELEGYSEEYRQRIKDEYYRNVNTYYDNLISDYKYERSLAMNRIYAEQDTNRYAIYAGYHGPWDTISTENWSMVSDPLFGVKWNGYMMARHGKIGYTSPWYIGDAGLTQKNNSGIIFLGDPETSGREYTADELLSFRTGNATRFSAIDLRTGNEVPIVSEDDGSQVTFLLKNSGKLRLRTGKNYTEWIEYTLIQRQITTNDEGAAIWEEIEPVFDREANRFIAIYEPAGNGDPNNPIIENSIRLITEETITEEWGTYEAQVEHTISNPFSDQPIGLPNISSVELKEMIDSSKIGPEAYGEYGSFAIYAGSDKEIHFGIRMDGTIFGNRAQFDEIRINNSTVVGTVVEHSNFLDITIANTLYDQNGNPIVDSSGNPYHSYFLSDDGHTTYIDQNGNTSTYYGGSTTYTDAAGNQQIISTTGQTFIDPAGHEYTLSGQGYSYSRPDGSYTYVDEDGMHFHMGYVAVKFNTEEDYNQNPYALGWYERTHKTDASGNVVYNKITCLYEKTTSKDTHIYTSKNESASTVCAVAKDEKVQIVRESDGYCVVSYKNNDSTYIGYIKAEDLSADTSNERPVVSDYENPQWTYVKTNDHAVQRSKINTGLAYFTYDDEEPIQFQFPTNISFQQADDAALADTIIREKMMLMGGTLSAWGTNKQGCMATYRFQGNDVVEAIALDAAQNQIRVGSGQLVLDGLNGILYIGNKLATNGATGSSIYTKGAIYLARVALVGLTTGATTYGTEMQEGQSITKFTTYTPIQYNQDATQDNDSDDSVTQTSQSVGTEDFQNLVGGADSLVDIECDVTPYNRKINLVNLSLNRIALNNSFSVGMFADEYTPQVDPDTGIPYFETDNEHQVDNPGYGFKLEFITKLSDLSTNELTPSYLTAQSYNGSRYTQSDLEDIGYEDGICIIRPFKTNSVLGTPARRWNIYANHVQIGDSYAATIQQVYENDARLQNNIIRVNEATAAAFQKAVQALNAAWSIIRRFKRYMRGELNEQDATALGLPWDSEAGKVITTENADYIAQAIAAALSQSGTIGESLQASIASALSQALANDDLSLSLQTTIASALSQALTDTNLANSLAATVSSLFTSEGTQSALSQAIATMLQSDTTTLGPAIAAALSTEAGNSALSSAVAQAIQSDTGTISSAITGLLTEGSALTGQIESIAESVFEEQWAGLTPVVSGSGDTVTFTITSPGGHTWTASATVTPTLEVSDCSVSPSSYVGSDGNTHYVSHTKGTASVTSYSWSTSVG